MSPTTMRCGSPGVSGEPFLVSKRGSTTSGGGNGKASSWAEGGREENASSEAELTNVVEVGSTAETVIAGVAEDKAKAGGPGRRGVDWEEEAEVV